MSQTTQSQPGDIDPRTIDPDGTSPPQGVPPATMLPSGPPVTAGVGGVATNYRPMKCYKIGPNKDFVGYLSTRGNQTVAIGTGNDYPAALLSWDSEMDPGALYLRKQTSPYDRFLGVGDWWYACWALKQVRNMGYFTNVIYNTDHTISPGTHPGRFLAGPYNKFGIDWVWWAPAGDPSILVCELE